MKLLIIIGKFPKVSETFIFRKVVALAENGHTIIVAARDPGDWDFFQDQLPLPEKVIVKYLVPDTRITDPHRIVRVLSGVFSQVISHPQKSYRLWKKCSIHRTNASEQIRLFLRYISFLGVEVDLIHFEFLPQSVMYILLPDLLNIDYVVSCRGADIHLYNQYSSDHKTQIRDVLHGAAAVHTVSQEISNQVQHISGRTNNIWVNRPAVSVDRISAKNVSASQKAPMILATGRLVWKKGFDYLLAALQKISQEQIEFSVNILGDGDLRPELQFSIDDLGLSQRVRLCGAVKPTEVLDYMQHADIFVLSSHEEGISNAVLEAMASGLPIVTTNAGGMAEAVRNEIDGFVVPVRDVDALANRLKQLLLDEQLRKDMGKAAREHSEEDFTLERQAKVFEHMYLAALHKVVQ